MQVEVVTAKFNKGYNNYYFSPNGLNLNKGDKVIVDTEKGRDIVTIVKGNHEIESSEIVDTLKNVIKMATEADVVLAIENDKKAKDLLPEVKQVVKSKKIDMKVVSVECNYNFTRLTVNFTAENRVDFRELVKGLAEKFKTRIELRQIGPRDATRIIGGLGCCGKECCCSQGLGIDDHVSIKMAKNQGLSLNPNSISGVCGKLLCCLAYENEYYMETLKSMPRYGTMVKTSDGEGKVIFCDLLKKTVSVRYQNENSSEVKVYPADTIKEIK